MSVYHQILQLQKYNLRMQSQTSYFFSYEVMKYLATYLFPSQTSWLQK